MEKSNLTPDNIQKPILPVSLSPKPNNWLKVGLYSLLALLLVAIAFLAYQNCQFRKQIQQAQVVTPTPIPTATPTPDQAVNWKTYKSERHGYEIKYPPSYQIGSSENALCLEKFSEQSYCDITVMLIDANGVSLETYIQTSFGFPQDKSLKEFLEEMGWEYSTRQIGDNSWFYFHHNEGPGEGWHRNFIKSDGIIVGIYAFTNEIQKSNEFNSMLFTFKFTD